MKSWTILVVHAVTISRFAYAVSAAVEVEPNNTRIQANSLDFGADGTVTVLGRVNLLADLDVFRIITPSFPGQKNLTILLTPTAADHELDARLQLLDASGNILTTRDFGGDNVAEALVFGQATGSTTYFVVCGSADLFVSGSGDYSLFVGLDDLNDQIVEAPAIGTLDQTRSENGTIDSPTDVDIFSFAILAGQRISFDIDQTSAGFDSYLRLFDPNGTQLAANNDAPGPGEAIGRDAYLAYSFTNSGTFYVGVSGSGNTDYSARTGAGDSNESTGSYTLITSPGLAGTIRRPSDTADYRVDLLRYGPVPQAINPNQRTWIVIHGWNSSRTEPNISQLADSLFRTRPGDQVLTLDWSAAAKTPLPFAAENSIVPVAEWAAAALSAYDFVSTNLNLVGHSFGSYVADEIAQRIPNGVDTIITLDPAANIVGGYDPVSSVDFARDSLFSWSFHASSLGNEYSPATADESFIVDSGTDSTSAHSNVVFLIAYMLLFPDDIVGQFFVLSDLLEHTFGPWVPDQFASYFLLDNPVPGYEAILKTAPSGTTAQSIFFVTNAPILTITSHASGTAVTSSPILLFGTATDSGRGNSGISSVIVNGERANNDTAAGTAVANWNSSVRLSAGANLITVVARDGSSTQAASTNLVTINYTPVAPTLSMVRSNEFLGLSWLVDYSDYSLQQIANFVSPDNWVEVPAVPFVVGSSNLIVVTISQSRQFFRLRKK